MLTSTLVLVISTLMWVSLQAIARFVRSLWRVCRDFRSSTFEMSGEKKLHTVSRGLQLFIFDGFTICGSFQPRFFWHLSHVSGTLSVFSTGSWTAAAVAWSETHAECIREALWGSCGSLFFGILKLSANGYLLVWVGGLGFYRYTQVTIPFIRGF